MNVRVTSILAIAVSALVGAAADADDVYSVELTTSWWGDGSPPILLTFENTPTPINAGTLSVHAVGDLDRTDENIALLIEGVPFGTLFDNEPVPSFEEIAIPLDLLAQFAADGSVAVTLDPSLVAGYGDLRVRLAYGAIPEPAALGLLLCGAALIRRRW